jgi:hypothetical protein
LRIWARRDRHYDSSFLQDNDQHVRLRHLAGDQPIWRGRPVRTSPGLSPVRLKAQGRRITHANQCQRKYSRRVPRGVGWRHPPTELGPANRYTLRSCVNTIAIHNLSLSPSQAELEWLATFDPDGIPGSEAVERVEGAFAANCLVLSQFMEHCVVKLALQRGLSRIRIYKLFFLKFFSG